MEQFEANSIFYLSLAAALVVGLIVGFLLGRVGGDKRSKSNLAAAQNELDEYKQGVQQHFSDTAEAFRSLNTAYADLHSKLAQGASELCADGDSVPLLQATVAQAPQQPPNTPKKAQAPKTQQAPPQQAQAPQQAPAASTQKPAAQPAASTKPSAAAPDKQAAQQKVDEKSTMKDLSKESLAQQAQKKSNDVANSSQAATKSAANKSASEQSAASPITKEQITKEQVKVPKAS